MKIVKVLCLSFFLVNLISCDPKDPKNTIQLNFENKAKTYHLNEAIKIEAKETNNKEIDSIVYTFQGKETKIVGNKVTVPLTRVQLGKFVLKIVIHSGENVAIFNPEITILNNIPPKVYSYKIINTYPHSTKHYTQGLEFKGDRLFESAGHYKESRLLEKDLVTGKTVRTHKLADTFFAEGLTIVGDKIHQLTWKGDVGFTYNLSDFKTIGTFAYNKSKQGWGLCYDGENTIYKSDGTTKIWKLNAQTLKEEGYIQITTNKGLKSKFNELEWVNGKIYANTWQKDSIAIINPENGAIEGIINLLGIRKLVGVASNNNDTVLNGIAYKKETNQLYITGKYWNKLFEIVLVN